MNATCPACHATWPVSERTGHCRGCCQTFGSNTAADKHRTGPHNARYCKDPAAIGMHLDDAGIWRLPQTDEGRARLAALKK